MIPVPKYSIVQCRHRGIWELWMAHDQDTHDVLEESYDKAALQDKADFLNRSHARTLARRTH